MKSIIKKFAIVSSMAVGLAAVGQANASTITLPRSITGTVTVEQSLRITCDFTGTLRSTSSGGLEIANPTFRAGNALCGTVVRANSGPWGVTISGPLSGTHANVPVTITGVGASTILGGSCSGTVTGVLNDNGSGHALTLNSATLPGSPTNCTVHSGTFNF